MKSKFFLSALIFCVLVEIVATAVMPITKGHLFNALELKSLGAWLGVGLLFVNYFVFDLCQAFKNYLIIQYSMIRRKLKVLELGIGMNTKAWEKGVDNVEQRIQEDVKLMYLNRYAVVVEYVVSAGILLWLLIHNYHEIFLVLSALAYAAISVLIAYLFNPRMKYAEKIVQNTEATFRLNLINTRNLLGFNEAIHANIKAATIRLQYLLFTKLQGGLVVIIPYLFLLTPYLTGQITLGVLVEHSTVFSLLVVNAAIVINMFPTLTVANASKERVGEIE